MQPMCTCNQPPLEFAPRSARVEQLFAWVWNLATTPLEKVYGPIKSELFAGLSGDVVEIGPGTGANFVHYPKGLTLRAIEPNPFMHPYLEKSAKESGIALGLHGGHAEAIDLPDNSADAVVSTLVFCSVHHPERVLAEVHRVLKPGGCFVFIEHVAAPQGTWVRAMQNFVQPLWTKVADGCHPNRDTGRLPGFERFSVVELDERHLPQALPLARHHVIGRAIK